MSDTERRDPCPRCGIKHIGKAAVRAQVIRALTCLAQADILRCECLLGYPYHAYYVMANMSEAEDEIAEIMPVEAEVIRAERKKIEQAMIDGRRIQFPDFSELMRIVAKGALLEEVQDDPDPEVTVDLGETSPN